MNQKHLIGCLLSGVVCIACLLHAAPLPKPASSAFACDLYRAIVAKHADENVLFSPFSLASMLAMTAEGARGETAVEMGKVLHAKPTIGDAEQAYAITDLLVDFADLNGRLTSKHGWFASKDQPEFLSANALWVDQQCVVERPYLNTVRKYLQAGEVFNADCLAIRPALQKRLMTG